MMASFSLLQLCCTATFVCGFHVVPRCSHSPDFPQVFIPNVAGSALSQSPKLHMLLYFLAYLSILVAAAA